MSILYVASGMKDPVHIYVINFVCAFFLHLSWSIFFQDIRFLLGYSYLSFSLKVTFHQAFSYVYLSVSAMSLFVTLPTHILADSA